MTTSLNSRSSWISEALYKAAPDGSSYLVFILKPSACPVDEHNYPIPTALLYGGPETPLPSWVPGLVAGGVTKEGKVSPGRAYHLLVKGKYTGQTVRGEDNVRTLKEMMK